MQINLHELIKIKKSNYWTLVIEPTGHEFDKDQEN